jgi:hypothetical protein
LRFVVVDYLMTAGREVTVAELAEVVTGQGFVLSGRPSKVISDGLRWEVRRGRVVRLGRGRYRYLRAPASTARRMRILAAASRAWVAARARGVEPPALPANRRVEPACRPPHPSCLPPWTSLDWLWGS